MAGEYKIGEVAELLETTVRSIRYYEEEGLLHPPRTEGGTRLYNGRHIARLKSILRMAENGFSIDSIRNIASAKGACKTGHESSDNLSALLEREMNVIAYRIRELERLKEEVAQAKAVIGQCRGCHNKPTIEACPDCPVRSHLESIELLNLIWDQEG